MTKEFTRRKFIATATLATGFALAVQPISAKTITTDAKGLIVGAVKIPVADGELPAYRAQPATGSNFPIVLVIQEIFGVHEHIQDVCRRFAKLGYVAIAPELFIRQGDVSKLSSIDQIRPIVAKVPDAQVMSDLDATVNWAVRSAKGNAERLGITGFCWGGRMTWLYAAHRPQVKAGVAWYGRLVGDATPVTPKHPIDIAASLKVPVLGLYGGKDTGIPLETVQQMQARLKTGQSQSEIIVYPDAPHAFFADYRPSYREREAIEGWQRLQAWFKRQGV
ncbi:MULTISPECIES: dienelactone hydrolase family protein [Leptolyngbya]|jgi:carboxymethylenebutenolidase|uniref:Twin-arginine translocation pathway signal protein n=2 Tax=Leptolyngbya boryana TaxID=1184 RepID=A0A1Z4JMM1_LEPBY|nr:MULTISPECIES: dienelactone hydrolase family protein [Leptolyngbya]BAY57946.1 twin-arginine translocation pathway signal protein [Leptolyngbya boryana NIES-2135]MBD2367390.1 dienelactone hydrolase family protein [Leptolyngbya sp. FACHB-161]MBD2373914.1 dienelactone hydrolase family protein [Leptolyngbya sp. FACHB-238]MBD2398286.1 dienelactone hydrolase family protein [Leptolyngbya sp. FACHB-239]MBD2404217.1 dienelactone hydrolase family protein [Leptolyngbya sp. FACHB-402]